MPGSICKSTNAHHAIKTFRPRKCSCLDLQDSEPVTAAEFREFPHGHASIYSISTLYYRPIANSHKVMRLHIFYLPVYVKIFEYSHKH